MKYIYTYNSLLIIFKKLNTQILRVFFFCCIYLISILEPFIFGFDQYETCIVDGGAHAIPVEQGPSNPQLVEIVAVPYTTKGPSKFQVQTCLFDLFFNLFL
jgi:hypothetical protein